MRLAWIALGVALGLVLAGGVIALEQLAGPASPVAPAAAPAPAHNMTQDERCQHMPEHCGGGA